MYDSVLNKIRSAIRRVEYVVTRHANLEMNEDNLTIFDLEMVILKGEIVERQRDINTGELKYRIRGILPDGTVEAIVKIGPDGSPVIITVYVV